MSNSRTVMRADFWRPPFPLSIDVSLENNKNPISLFGGDIDHCSKELSKNEIDTVIQILLVKKEEMSGRGNFPYIYDEMLSDLIMVYKERYGRQVWKGEDMDDITSECHYTLSINQLEELLEKRYAFKAVRIDSIIAGSNVDNAVKIKVGSDGILFVSFREVEEDE